LRFPCWTTARNPLPALRKGRDLGMLAGANPIRDSHSFVGRRAAASDLLVEADVHAGHSPRATCGRKHHLRVKSKCAEHFDADLACPLEGQHQFASRPIGRWARDTLDATVARATANAGRDQMRERIGRVRDERHRYGRS
jgi:hypothetical protein